MRKRLTPSPDPQSRIGCVIPLVLIAAAGIVPLVVSHRFWTIIFVIPLAAFLVSYLFEKALLLLAQMQSKDTGKVGILVTSDSPHWKDYIEEEWLPRLSDAVSVLNWSQRSHWASSIQTRIFYKFVGAEENYCPSVVLLRGLKHPLIFRYYYAFRDARHGNAAARSALEARMFEEFAKMGRPTSG